MPPKRHDRGKHDPLIDEGDNDISMIQEWFSLYRLPYQNLLSFLRHLFGEGKFHVRLSHSHDMYCMTLPRHLSDEEQDQILELRERDEYFYSVERSDSESESGSERPVEIEARWESP